MNDKRVYSILTMAGITPFVACAILPLAGFDSVELLGPLADVAAGYGLAIISFLAGIHWATQIYDRRQGGFNLLISSNVVFVAVWLAYALGTIEFALGTQIVALLVLLGVDRQLLGDGVITPHYYRTRTVATALAVLSFAVILFTS